MYCSNCGYHLDDDKCDKISQSNPDRTADSVETFVCPRCGRVIKENLNEEEVKSLARASHSSIHRARNSINTGLAFLVISIILLTISFMFYLLSFKAALGGQFITNCSEFYTFVILLVLGIAALTYSIVRLVLGITQHRRYSHLLKDIQNGIFVQ